MPLDDILLEDVCDQLPPLGGHGGHHAGGRRGHGVGVPAHRGQLGRAVLDQSEVSIGSGVVRATNQRPVLTCDVTNPPGPACTR